MIVEVFGQKIQAYLRTSGYDQKELAPALGLNPKVLSRKLRGSSEAYFTMREVRELLLRLIDWQVITKHEELLDLFAEAQIDPAAVFRESEWQEPPLSTLTRQRPSLKHVDQPAFLHNLPAPTRPLIGRSWAVARLQQLFARRETRMVTLTGPGGCGKTRLALHMAYELAATFAQGAWLILFTGVSDPAMVPLTIAHALDIKSTPDQEPLQSLKTYLRHREVLLVLDNFEHLLDASGLIQELLDVAPGLKILLTSRIVLHLPAEHELSVPPLDLPDLAASQRMDAQALMDYSAIQLFVERAQAAFSNFALTDENAPLIAQICSFVDGLPLALELAAARIKVLPPQTLLERLLHARLSLLTRTGRPANKQNPDRHQTLRETIKWSYDLLTPDEQTWFRRLGTFLGGWTLESLATMIREINADERLSDADATTLALDLITSLVDNSLIVRMASDPERETYFTMLSTLREYALERLEANGETERLHTWHACYFLRQAEAGEVGLRGPNQLKMLARMTDTRDNLRSALEWSLQKARADQQISFFPPTDGLSHEVASCRTLSEQAHRAEQVPALEVCLRLATAMRAYWEWQGMLTEARLWLSAALALPMDEQAGLVLRAARARALSESARLTVLENDQEKALELVDESITLWRSLDDPPGLATALEHRGWALHGKNEYEAAEEVYQEALALLSPTTDTWLYGQILIYLGGTAGFTSNYDKARRYYARCRELFEQVGDKAGVADVWKDQGGILIIAGAYDEAITCLLTSIQVCRAMDHKQYITTALCSLSFAFGLRELPNVETAALASAQIQGAAESLMETIGLTPWTNTTPFVQFVRQAIRSRVDPERWQAALNTGRALSLDQTIELVVRLSQLS